MGLCPVLAFGHFMIFPGETRCMFIEWSKYQKDSDLYVEPGTGAAKLMQVKQLIHSSKGRVRAFWGSLDGRPQFIFCNSSKEFEKYAGPGAGPACSFMKLRGYIVISNDGLQTDIISHELSHIELYSRIGFWKNVFLIPAWFHEGLAMQVDNRPDFSTDSLRKYSVGFTHLPDLQKLRTTSEFNTGTPDEVILNYAAAKYTVAQWNSPGKLNRFITLIHKGKGFDEAWSGK